MMERFIPYILPRNSCCYSVPGTESFRLGSRMITVKITSPPREGKRGSNMQNWERSVRKIFLSDGWNYNDPDEVEKLRFYLSLKPFERDVSIFTEEQRNRIRIFVSVDQAGAEALIVAYLCRHGNFRDLFIYNIKPHVYVALFVFAYVWKKEMENTGSDIKCDIDLLCNLPIREVTSNPFWRDTDKLIRSSDKWPSERRYYYIAKQICHSSNYGITSGMFQLNTLEKSKGKIVISKAQAEHYLSVYHGLFPEIREWHREVERQVKDTHYLFNLFGFPRYCWFPGDHPTQTDLKEMYAFPAQSTVATITNIAYTKLQQHIEDTHKQWDLLANTHDSYMAQVPIGEEKIAVPLMQELINQELTSPIDGTKFNMKSEAKVGFNWGDYDKVNNTLGLVEI